MYVSDLLISEDRDWACTRCGAWNNLTRGVCPDCDYPEILRIFFQDDCVLFMMVLCI